MGVTNLNACIGYPAAPNDPYLTRASVEFHTHLGFEWVGRFHGCGYKFGRWYDMVCFVNLSFHKTASVRFTRQREDSSRTSVALAPILSSPTTPRA